MSDIIEEYRDGILHILCKHKKELCHECMKDFRMPNEMERKRCAVDKGKQERKEIKKEGKSQGCAYAGCAHTNPGDGTRLLHCSACKQVFYCSKECQTGDWPNHKKPCKSNRQQIQLDEASTSAHPLGAKLEQLVEGEPTGIICRVTQFNKDSKTYILQDLELAAKLRVTADLVGPTDWTDRQGKLHKSKANQPWKILQGNELSQYGFLGEPGMSSCFPGAVCFFPYGLGPYGCGEIVQQYISNKPTGLFCRIVEIIYPPGKEPKGEEDEGDFGKGISEKELKAYSYVLQPCPKRLHGNYCEVEAQVAHDKTKWRVLLQ